MTIDRPLAEEYSPFYSAYIATVGNDVLSELNRQALDFTQFLLQIPENKSLYAYAEGKWTICQVAGHVLDIERIMTYRALRIARHDETPLPGFDENRFVDFASFNNRTLLSFSQEFSLLRQANLFLFSSFTADDLDRKGMCSNAVISVRALLYIIAGHINHHRRILNERYL